MIFIDSQFRLALDQLLELAPGGMNAAPTIHGRRELIDQMLLALPRNENVAREDYLFENSVDGSMVKMRIYTPLGAEPSESMVLAIHGGGMVMGGIETDDANSSNICEQLQVRVAAVEYRLAPEHPFPAALHDCYSAFRWLVENSEFLAINPKKISLFGGSAGAGLALGLALFIRDRKEPNAAFVMAPYPMIDHRSETLSSHEIIDLGVWDRQANIESWNWYLADDHSEVSSYASPSLATDLRHLPPIFIDVGTADLFRDENIDFAARLARAGNRVEFHLYPGAFHAAELFAPEADLAQIIWSRRFSALKKWLS